MKAKSKAAKRRKRRGRPRLPPMARESNGRQSRRKASIDARDKETRRDTMETVIERRMREALGIGEIITEVEAKDPRRGYVLGLMLLDGTVTKAEHDAGVAYAEMLARYYRSTGVPFPSARAQNLFAVRGADGEVSANQAAAARAASNDFMRTTAILQNQPKGRAIATTVFNVCFMDIAEARHWPGHMIALLKKGLQTLASRS